VTTGVDASVLWARAVLLGSLAFFLGVVGHVSADGLLPGPILLTVLLVMSVLLSAPMLNRRASPLRLVAMLVGGQTVIHLVLTVTAGHAGDRAAANPTPRGTLGTLPTVDGHRVGSLQDAYQGMSGEPTSIAPAVPIGHLINDLSAHAPMMVVHLAAAAALGLWLAYGERCLWTVLAMTGRRILAAAWALRPAVAAPRLAAPDAHRSPAGPRSVWLVRADSRRGPPLLAA
jgi:hypothetical protein